MSTSWSKLGPWSSSIVPRRKRQPTDQDQYDVSIDLVTMAGTEYTMPTNLTHYEDIMQLEDDILCFQRCPTLMFLDAK